MGMESPSKFSSSSEEDDIKRTKSHLVDFTSLNKMHEYNKY